MKTGLLILGAVICAASCNTTPKNAEAVAVKTDSILPKKDTVYITQGRTTTSATRSVVSSPASSSSNGTTETMTSTSTNEAQTKTGWSKTAKGAVIGGVVGAGTGAIVNKKNRAAGAVVGGVLGAGGGAIIGNEMDKKDGRH